MRIPCHHCGALVLPMKDNVCPACNQTMDRNAPSPSSPVSPTTSGRPPSRFRVALARRAVGGALLGLLLAAWGALGGSYQRRGVGYTARGGELVGLGVAIFVIGILIWLLARPRRA